MSAKIVPSKTNENLEKLRVLTYELNNSNSSNNDEYEIIVKKLKTIVDGGKKELENSKSPQSKIKCYETMCKTITNILNNIK